MSEAIMIQNTPNGEGENIVDLVIEDIKERSEVGFKKYGQKLKANNGRDALIDAYQEVLDLAQYIKQKIVEGKKHHCTQCEVLKAEVERLKADGYISVNDSLPSCENGFIDTSVLVCVKNKNKDGGIYLYDTSSFDGEKWSRRCCTWEDILFWRPIPCKT